MPGSWASALLVCAFAWILAGFQIVGVVLASLAVVIEVASTFIAVRGTR
jgi:hypothetical protein